MGEKEDLGAIVGSECVFDDPETLEGYSKDSSFVVSRKPDFVVKPGSAEAVQGLVKWANETSMPLIPVSSGPPRFKGDTIPRLGGVIVDLSGMNKIAKIDRKNRVCMIEPGVTFSQLQPELAKEGMRMSLPLLPRSAKSVIACFLEKEPITMPMYHWDYTDPLCCVEVVFGSGDVFCTGEASGPGSIEEQWAAGGAQKFPLGPHQVDYHRIVQGAQGTMGIVTWASVKCELMPKMQKLFIAPSDSLENLIDFSYRLLRLDIGEEILILNSLDLAMILADDADGIEELRASLPKWNLLVCISGFDRRPEERMAYLEEDLKELARKYGVEMKTSVSGVRGEDILSVLSKPSSEPYWKLKLKGGCHDIFFVTTLEKSPEYIKKMRGIAAEMDYPTQDIGIYIQPQVQGTSCHCEFNLTCDPNNETEMEKVQEFFMRVSEEMIKEGAFFTRPYGSWSDMAYRREAEYVMALRKVKGIFDPNNVMNPGRLCF